MIKRSENMISEIRDRMRGGTGQVSITHLWQPGEFHGKARLIARIILGPGCSIGGHEHVHEEEIYTIIRGQAAYMDGREGEEQILQPGDASLTLNGQFHSIRNAGPEPLEFLAMILLDS